MTDDALLPDTRAALALHRARLQQIRDAILMLVPLYGSEVHTSACMSALFTVLHNLPELSDASFVSLQASLRGVARAFEAFASAPSQADALLALDAAAEHHNADVVRRADDDVASRATKN